MNDSLAMIAEEITMVRKLLIFGLLNSGLSQEKLATALGVSQATVSRLVGARSQGSGRTKGKKAKN